MDQGLLAEFLAECGLDAPYRVEVFAPDDAMTQTHEFRQPFLVVGQREGSDLRLDHWLVGRRHVYLQLIDGRFRCVDLGARTGTHGGNPTERAGWVDPDRPLKIGPYQVRPLIPTDVQRDYPPLPIVTWSRVDQAATSPHWSMNRALALLGRSPFCEFRLADPGVSRFHCGLVLTAQGVWVVDLLSQKPVLVNGEAIRFAPVRPGDTLQVGPYQLTPHYDMSLIQAVQQRAAWTPVEEVKSPLEANFPGEIRPQGRKDFPREILADTSPDSAGNHLPALTPSLLPASYWTPAPPALGDLAQIGSNEMVVSALVEQFGAMQQQMFDQFHQMILGMFERFADLHRETSTSVRAEFDEVRKLSDEIEMLRSETARLAEVSTLAMQQTALDRSSQHQSTSPPPAPPLSTNPPRPSGPKPTRPGAVPPSGPIPSPGRSSTEAPSGDAGHRLPPSADVTADIHAQLCRRLNSIETERQGRLQKIWAMMMTAKT